MSVPHSGEASLAASMAQAAAPPTALLGPRASVCSPPHAAPIRGSGSGAYPREQGAVEPAKIILLER